jgi:hypothetical protein
MPRVRYADGTGVFLTRVTQKNHLLTQRLTVSCAGSSCRHRGGKIWQIPGMFHFMEHSLAQLYHLSQK